MRCQFCKKVLRGPNGKPPRPDKRFCSRDCRYASWDAEHPRVPVGNPSDTPRPASSRTTPRRRRENGAKVYLLPDELAALITGGGLGLISAMGKLGKAQKRIEARS